MEEQAMEEQEIHLKDYLRVVRKRKTTVITFFIITLTVVLVATFSATPIYQASTKVLIEKNTENPLLETYGIARFDPSFLETQAQIIKSAPVAEKVIGGLELSASEEAALSLAADVKSIPGLIIGWGKALVATIQSVIGIESADAISDIESPEAAAATRVDKLVKMLNKNIRVSPVRDTKIVTVDFTSPSPVLAAMIANSVARAYIGQILEMHMESSGYNISWMTQKADEERARLEQSEKELQAYMKAHDIVTVEDRIAILPQKMTDINRQLTVAETRRKELGVILRKATSVSDSPREAETLPIIADSPDMQALKRQIIKADHYIIELSKKYGHKHPLMKRAQADLQALNDKRSQEIARIIKSIRNEYDMARSNEENLENILTQTKSDAGNLNERFIQYGILKREVETNRKLYDALVSRIKEQNVTEKIQTVKVWIVEEAKPPEFPAKPNKKRNVLLGIILGAFGGIGLAFFLEYLDNTIKLPEDVEDRFGLPVLGLVPLIREIEKDSEHVDVTNLPDIYVEGYKSIRTAVQLSSHERPPQALLITSMSPKDGKTTTAANLAIAMSQADKQVLLLDADMRRPRVHKLFKLDNAMGLSTCLAGVTDNQIIQKTAFENLSVICSGPIPPNPSELLGSERFKGMVKLLRQKFDAIIIDSPPLLTVADSLLVSQVVDGTIVVSRSAKTTHDVLYKGLKKLADIGTKITGVVINAANLKKSGYYYYSDYQYYYSSDEE